MKNINRKISALVLGIFIAGQIGIVSAVLLIPKPAEAVLGVADFTFTTQIANPYDVIKDIGIAASRQIAINIAEKFLTRFTNKLTEKYKIRNFLYYDQILSDYYLSNYIRDKIGDPDLEKIFALLEAGYVSGTYTGTTNAPNPNNALIPQFKKAVSDLYIKQGGIPAETLATGNPNKLSGTDFFNAAQFWSVSPQSSTASNLQAQFGAFQSSATTAAQLEVIVGNGLKAGRVIGGTCTVSTANTPTACTAAGGTWKPSALDQARSFIENPTATVTDYLDSAIHRRIDNNFNPTDYWAVIGSLIGNLLFRELTLDKSSGVLNEDPRGYTPVSANEGVSTGRSIDIDGDGIPDGYDSDGDGVIDVCTYGGTAPACVGSVAASTVNTTVDCTQSPDWMSCNSPDHADLVARVKAYVVANVVPNGQFNTYCDIFEIVKRVAWALRNEGGGLLTTPHTTQCNGFSADVIAYSDNSQVDILSSADPGGDPQPTWQPAPPSSEAGVRYAAPTDPGDPPGSY